MNQASDMHLQAHITDVSEAISAHGILFKKALRSELEGIPGIRIIGEEYPVRYLEGAAVDLLVELEHDDCKVLLSIECKRSSPEYKSWIFFEEREQKIKSVYHFLDRNCMSAMRIDLESLMIYA